MSDAIAIAVRLIKQFEGCKLKAYVDQAGRWTLGWGTTQGILAGFADKNDYPLIQVGSVWTQAQADQALQESVQHILGQIQGVLGQSLLTSLNSNQLAAVIDFVYNLGIGSFQHSGLLRGIRSGNLQAASQNILLWNRIGSYVSPGLTRRRQAEHDLFVAPLTDPTSGTPQPSQP